MDYTVTEQREVGNGRRFYAVEYRPTLLDLRALRLLGLPKVHSNHFYMDAPKSIRGVLDNGQWVTRSGRRVPKGTTILGRQIDDWPANDPRDPYLWEAFIPDRQAIAERNISAYWERKLQAADEGKPYPQHHRTTLNLEIGASADDAWEAQNGTLFTSTDTRFIAQAWSTTDSRLNGGGRFTNITVAVGSTINSCVLQLRAIATTEDDMRSDVYFNDVDDAADFSTEADVTSRTLTTATASWVALSQGTSYVSSPALATVLQEVVDRAGWASGADVVVLVRGKNATNNTGNFYAEGWDHAGTEAPLLDIDYTAPGATTNPGWYSRGGWW